MRVVGIRDFEMPSCCAGCKFGDLMRVADGEPYDYFICLLNDQEHDPEEQHRPFNCPLVWAEVRRTYQFSEREAESGGRTTHEGMVQGSKTDSMDASSRTV